jgi:hypothetical protein
VGTQIVAVQVDDGQGGLAGQAYPVVVSSAVPDQPPVITSMPLLSAIARSLYQYQVTGRDPEHEALHFALPTAPDGMMIDATTGVVRWTPPTAQVGQNVAVTVTATDTAGNVAAQGFTLAVRDVNRPPVITTTPVTAVTAGLA